MVGVLARAEEVDDFHAIAADLGGDFREQGVEGGHADLGGGGEGEGGEERQQAAHAGSCHSLGLMQMFCVTFPGLAGGVGMG